MDATNTNNRPGSLGGFTARTLGARRWLGPIMLAGALMTASCGQNTIAGASAAAEPGAIQESDDVVAEFDETAKKAFIKEHFGLLNDGDYEAAYRNLTRDFVVRNGYNTQNQYADHWAHYDLIDYDFVEPFGTSGNQFEVRFRACEDKDCEFADETVPVDYKLQVVYTLVEEDGQLKFDRVFSAEDA